MADSYHSAPRFIVKVDRGSVVPGAVTSWSMCTFYILELVPGMNDHWRIPRSLRNRTVRRVLKRIGPLDVDGEDSSGLKAFTRAERVVHALNRMDLALQAAELRGDKGMKELVEYLWLLEGEDVIA